jgi:hypothetical protein
MVMKSLFKKQPPRVFKFRYYAYEMNHRKIRWGLTPELYEVEKRTYERDGKSTTVDQVVRVVRLPKNWFYVDGTLY